jgi:ribosomal protein S27AE
MGKIRKENIRYTIKDGKLYQNRPFCERCGTGVMMGEEDEFYVCGKCGLRKPKSLFQVQAKREGQ